MLNIVVPMAGLGSRFVEKGYTFPKPLLEIKGKPMIQVVVENLKPNIDHRFIFIVRKEHMQNYALKELLNHVSPGCIILPIDQVTEGAACTVLLAMDYIDNEDALLIANSDQYVDICFDDFLKFCGENNSDGTIMTFQSTHPKWSYAKVDKNGNVVEVAEKRPISDKATVGIYYYAKGNDFCRNTEKMIEKDVRVNNEFYVCPVYNEFVLNNKKIKIYDIKFEEMCGLGTPEDYESFLKSDIIKNV